MSVRVAPSPLFLHVLAGLLALGHALLAVTATVEKSLTADEIAHLTAGHIYNARGDYRFQPENGNLPQRWAALPTTLAQPPLPGRDLQSWRHADVWKYGATLYHDQGLEAGTLFFLGRGMIALLSAGLGLMIFHCSRRHFGWRGGFLALALYALSPSFLVHGALATSDLAMSFFFLAAVLAWWRHLERPGVAGAAVSTSIFGLACVTKASAALLLPIFGLIALAWISDRAAANGWRGALGRVTRSAAIHAAGAWFIIWFFYGFRFVAFDPAQGALPYNHGWDWMLSDLGWPRPIILALRDWHLLPDAFLYGFTYVWQFAKQRGAFFNGEYSIHGWRSFFPYAFAVKTTLSVLLLVGLGAAGLARGWGRSRLAGLRARARPFTPLIALVAVYGFTSVASHLNIGHRHLLPIYPPLFIALGGFGGWLTRSRPLAAAVVLALAAGHAVESFRIRPHYLAFFNPLAGGPENGWRHLVDSSLDWGQDLPGLQRWLTTHAAGERVHLAYFGTADPAYEGIVATMLPSLPEVSARRRPWHRLEPGIYAISATMLQQVYTSLHGDWTAAREAEYQRLRELEPAFVAFERDPARRAELLEGTTTATWEVAWRRYEALRFARLCFYLRVREPETMIGYAILVHRLSAAEVAATTGPSLADWRAAIEAAITGHDSP